MQSNSRRLPCSDLLVFACALLASACSSELAQGPGRQASEIELSAQGIPLEDVECQVRELNGSVREYVYEAATRTLSTDKLRITFDEAGRYLTRGEPSGEWLHEYEYDEHGHATEFRYFWQGDLSPDNSVSYTPSYESGLLTELTFASANGRRSGTTEFAYEAGRVSGATTTSQFDGTETVREQAFRYDDQGRLTEVEQGVELMRLSYDAEGRLREQTMDGFHFAGERPDGTPEIKWRWYYDDAGSLYRFTVDGTTELDNPVVDGKLDVDRRFSPSCTALLLLGSAEIFMLPRAPGSY